MSHPDPFHEAKQALNSAKIEYSSVGSLSLVGAFSPLHACDLALRELYTVAVNKSFPHDAFKPHHQPGRLAEQLGIKTYYSRESQQFLDQLQGYALHEVRYEGTQAHQNYTSSKSAQLASHLIKGAERLIGETEKLSHDPRALDEIRKNTK